MQGSADVDHKVKGYINHAFHAADRKTFPLLYCILGCCLLGSASGAHPAYFKGGVLEKTSILHSEANPENFGGGGMKF